MITKVLHVTGISRFDSSRAVQLAKVTVLYAENGRGKTTLAEALRSLSIGNPQLILERRTLGTIASPTLGILVRDGSANRQFTFDGAQWNATYPDIDIFDTRFVSENVYSGQEVDPEHRRQLHLFVLGAQSVTLASRVDALDRQIKDVNAALTPIELEIAKLAGSGLPLEAFVSLAFDPETGTRIGEQETRLHAARHAELIRTTAGYSELVVPDINESRIAEVLARTLEDISSDAEAQVRRHVSQHLDAHGERWVSQGLAYLGQGRTCPFCGEDTSSSGLVTSYKAFFNAAYRQHCDDVQQLARDTAASLSDSAVRGVEGAIASNTALTAFWGQLSVAAPPAFESAYVRRTVSKAAEALNSVFTRKMDDVLADTSISSDAQEALRELRRLLANAQTYNAQVDAANTQIRALKADAGRLRIEDEAGKLESLRTHERRYQADARSHCDNWRALRTQKGELEAQKAAAKQDLDQATDVLFATYQTVLNRHLTNSGCGYSITGTRTAYTGGRPRTEYKLQIDSHVVELVQPRGEPLAPAFKNTLSQGDISTLAFAFFLARLDIDPRLSAKIVVFDDPMTSQDSHRRSYTAQQVAQVGSRCLQLILLTHDAQFARDVWNLVREQKAALTIVRQGVSTALREWDLEAATEPDYFRHCRVVQDHIAGTTTESPRSVAMALRPILEGNLRVRFPGLFRNTEWLGDFIGAIRNAKTGDALAALQPQLQELQDLNDYSKRYHHDQNQNADNEPVVEAELASYAARVIRFLAGV